MVIALFATSLSGCSGIENNVTATPSAGPTATPVASQPSGDGHLSSLGQLIHPDNLNSYTYRVTQTTYGISTAFDTDISYSDAEYKGLPAKRTIITQSDLGSNGLYMSKAIEVVFLSKANGSVLGGMKQIQADGQLEYVDMAPGEADSAVLSDILYNAIVNSGIPLTYVDNDRITINNKTYDCARYSIAIKDTNETEWYTSLAPMPVKSLWQPNGNYTQVTELLSWN